MIPDDEETGEIYICIDGQNVSLNKELKIVGLLSILRQLKKISDRSGFRYRLRDMRKEWNGLVVGPDDSDKLFSMSLKKSAEKFKNGINKKIAHIIS